jgi:hypothetical protein
LAGCPPAEPASASPTGDDSQQSTLPYNDFSANGNYPLNFVSQSKGALQTFVASECAIALRERIHRTFGDEVKNSSNTYYWFDGIALAPDGRELILEYADPDQGGTKLCFRYIISLDSSPKLLIGYSYEIDRSEREIGYDEIPQDVFNNAHDWLVSNLETATKSNKDALVQILTKYLEIVDRHRVLSRASPIGELEQRDDGD